MRFINKDKVTKELGRFTKLTEEQKDVISQVKTMINSMEESDAIPVDWFHKQLIEEMYNQKLSSECLVAFHSILARWRKINEQ